MLSWPFFIRFSSNFHQLPIFWHWSQYRFQNWHFFLCFMPITHKCFFSHFSADLAKIFISDFDTDHSATFKIDIFSLFHPYNSKLLFGPFFNQFGSNFHQPPNFGYRSHSSFQKWHFFRFTTITQKCYFICRCAGHFSLLTLKTMLKNCLFWIHQKQMAFF